MHASIDQAMAAPFAGTGLSVAYVIDPRFPGGTSSAVAAELEVVSRNAQVQVFAIESKMFTGRHVAPRLGDTLLRMRLPIVWDAREISADIVIFHNPSCLKFQDSIGLKIIARHLIVVTHENFLRPGGAPAFDVEKCLSQIASASIALTRRIAPISAWNRATTEAWCREAFLSPEWSVLQDDWFNICSFEHKQPTSSPRDRRGRHSRPGLEKFPTRDVLALCFPETARSNIILGADILMRSDDMPTHWALYPFGGLALDRYFDEIDFFVYFTSATWRESFGRVIAEAIAAGKLAITDPETAETFGGAAVGAAPGEVDGIIANYISEPDRYRVDVLSAQAKLDQFSAEAFQIRFSDIARASSGPIS